VVKIADAFTDDVPAVANQISDDIDKIEQSLGFLKDCFEALCSGWSDSSAASLKAQVLQPQNIWLPVRKFTPTTTNGCAALTNVELATNDIQIEYMAFDPGTQEHATISLALPEGYDLGTIKAKFFYIPATGCSAADVVQWGISAVAVSNDDPIDATFGTAVTVTDAITAGVEADLHVSAATAAITVGGTPVLGDLVHIKVYRDADDAADTMDAEDAWLLGIMLQITIDQAVTAW